jgi:hypothetical protein
MTRHAERLGGFLHAQAAEKPHLDDFALSLVVLCQFHERVVECDEVAAWFVRDRHVVDERDLPPPPPRFWYCFERAKSQRMRRISRAATARKCARFCQFTLRASTNRRYASFTSAVAWRLWPGRSPVMQALAIRCSSSWTIGISWSSAVSSPWPQARRSLVTWGELVTVSAG